MANLKVDNRIEKMLELLASAGCTEDQARNFVNGGYVLIPGYESFHAAARAADRIGGPEWIALGGKRGPGKSHSTMAQVGLDDCQRVPGLKVLFLRKLMKSAAESLGDLAERVFRYIPHNPTANQVEFENGSHILLGGYQNERDIDKYLGLEYDIIVIEEGTQISESKKDKIRGSLRSSKPNWRPRIYLTTNADGIGLIWFKKMFVIPWRAGRQTDTWFLDVTHIKNPFINPEYDAWLQSLTGRLRKAWLEGDWDAFSGMAFPEWQHDEHTCKPFEVPEHWPKWTATDWGKAAPFCNLWFTRDPDIRRVYVFRELYRAGLTDKQQAELIVENTPPAEQAQIKIHYADPALWTTKSKENTVYSTADEYAANGIVLTRADNDRISGKRKIDRLLANLPDGMPGLIVFESCPHLIEQMESLALDELHPEDVDTDQEDHAYDTLKYGLTGEKSQPIEPPKPKQRADRWAGMKHV